MITIKYDYEIGRFTSVDPLWEKYTGWTGYQYSLNKIKMIIKHLFKLNSQEL